MPSTVYEPIMAALLAHMQSECGSTFNTYARKLLVWQDLIQSIQSGGQVPPMPALYVYDGPGFGGGIVNYQQSGRTPVKRSKQITMVIYAVQPPGENPGASLAAYESVFYPLIESVEAALEPDPSSSFATITLGGRVVHCWIEGDGVLVPGDIDVSGQGMATLPVSLLIP